MKTIEEKLDNFLNYSVLKSEPFTEKHPDFKFFLYSMGVYEEFKYNWFNYKHRVIYSKRNYTSLGFSRDLKIANDTRRAMLDVYLSFNWIGSKEGGDFWKDINDKWVEYFDKHNSET